MDFKQVRNHLLKLYMHDYTAPVFSNYKYIIYIYNLAISLLLSTISIACNTKISFIDHERRWNIQQNYIASLS